MSNICVFATCTSYPLGNRILSQFVVKKMVKEDESTVSGYRCLFMCLACQDIQDDNNVSHFYDATLAKYLQFHDFMAESKLPAHRSHGIYRPRLETTASSLGMLRDKYNAGVVGRLPHHSLISHHQPTARYRVFKSIRASPQLYTGFLCLCKEIQMQHLQSTFPTNV